MRAVTVPAYAKLNLTLGITGLAPNGYHTLDMVMHTVSLSDTVTLTEADSISLDCPSWLPQGPSNLAWRAADALRASAGLDRGAVIRIEKRIPAEAGLGGGSADAAAVLKGLNELWGLGLSVEELCKIGLALGSDVPFAVTGGTARVRGVGDLLEPVSDTPRLWFALAKPEGGVGTAQAYRRFDAVGSDARPQAEPFIRAMQAGDIDRMAYFGGNALERAAVELLPAIRPLLDAMRARARYGAMTGSGAAVFGVFDSEKEASDALDGIDAPWKAIACSI